MSGEWSRSPSQPGVVPLIVIAAKDSLDSLVTSLVSHRHSCHGSEDSFGAGSKCSLARSFSLLLTCDSVNSSSIRLVAIASSFPSIVISPLRSPSSLGYLVSQQTVGNMEAVKDEPLSQKVNLREKSTMPPPIPKSSAPIPSSPKKIAAEVQVKASQPTREATPPTSDALSPRSAQVQGEEDEDDDETDQDPTQEVDNDETMHDLQSYDWPKLEHEYELAMAQCDEKEKEATEEFRKLANVSSGVYEVKATMC